MNQRSMKYSGTSERREIVRAGGNCSFVAIAALTALTIPQTKSRSFRIQKIPGEANVSFGVPNQVSLGL